jgi:hypothetical protein
LSKGFSLLETILAGFIISLITMAVFNIFPTSAMAAKRGEMQLIADSIALRELEQLRAVPFDTLILGPGPVVTPETQAGTVFSTQIQILDAPPSDPNVLKRVQAVVTWSHSNKNYSVTHEAWLIRVES